MKPVRPVHVEFVPALHTPPGTLLPTGITYSWATSATVTRKGDLKIYEGLQQRVFHPAGEWASYTVSAAQAADDTTRERVN